MIELGRKGDPSLAAPACSIGAAHRAHGVVRQLLDLETRSKRLRSVFAIAVFSSLYSFSPLLQDLRAEFVEHLIYPAVQANCIYEVRFPPSLLSPFSRR